MLLKISFLFLSFLIEIVILEQPEEQVIPVPEVPKSPACDHAPGTPEFSNCWENFRKDMSFFHFHLQEYSQQLAKMIERKISQRFGQSGTLSLISNGYQIQTKGLNVQTSSQNGVFQIKLPIPGSEHIDSKFEGQVIDLRVGTPEHPRLAKIQFPENVKQSELKIQRTEEGITVTGPLKNSWSQNNQPNVNHLSAAQIPSSNYAFIQQTPSKPSQMWFFK